MMGDLTHEEAATLHFLAHPLAVKFGGVTLYPTESTWYIGWGKDGKASIEHNGKTWMYRCAGKEEDWGHGDSGLPVHEALAYLTPFEETLRKITVIRSNSKKEIATRIVEILDAHPRGQKKVYVYSGTDRQAMCWKADKSLYWWEDRYLGWATGCTSIELLSTHIKGDLLHIVEA